MSGKWDVTLVVGDKHTKMVYYCAVCTAADEAPCADKNRSEIWWTASAVQSAVQHADHYIPFACMRSALLKKNRRGQGLRRGILLHWHAASTKKEEEKEKC
ncbi:hypothetical protein ACJX0J_034953 [Zea mays]